MKSPFCQAKVVGLVTSIFGLLNEFNQKESRILFFLKDHTLLADCLEGMGQDARRPVKR